MWTLLLWVKNSGQTKNKMKMTSLFGPFQKYCIASEVYGISNLEFYTQSVTTRTPQKKDEEQKLNSEVNEKERK